MMGSRRHFGLINADCLFGVVVLLAGALGVWCWHWPMHTQIKVLGDRLAAQQTARSELETLTATVERIRSEAADLETRLASYEVQVLNSGKGRYLETVSDVQERCGVAVEQIVPGEQEGGEFYDFIPIEVVTRGSIAESLCFVHELEARLWSADLVDLHISAAPETQTCKTAFKLNVFITRAARDGAASPLRGGGESDRS